MYFLKMRQKKAIFLQMLSIFQGHKLNQQTLKMKIERQKQDRKTIFFKKNNPKDIETDKPIKQNKYL